MTFETPVRDSQERPARQSRTASVTVENGPLDNPHSAHRLRRCDALGSCTPRVGSVAAAEPLRRTPEPTPPQKSSIPILFLWAIVSYCYRKFFVQILGGFKRNSYLCSLIILVLLRRRSVLTTGEEIENIRIKRCGERSPSAQRAPARRTLSGCSTCDGRPPAVTPLRLNDVLPPHNRRVSPVHTIRHPQPIDSPPRNFFPKSLVVSIIFTIFAPNHWQMASVDVASETLEGITITALADYSVHHET